MLKSKPERKPKNSSPKATTPCPDTQHPKPQCHKHQPLLPQDGSLNHELRICEYCVEQKRNLISTTMTDFSDLNMPAQTLNP